MAALIALLLLSSCTESITLESLLLEMSDRQLLTYFPDPPYQLRQMSSYNRASVSPDTEGWFANADMSHFIRVEQNGGRREFVLFDAPGPGAVVRWWMTFYRAQEGTLRIYIDENPVPVLEGPPHELLSGNAIAPYPLAASVQLGAPRGEEGRDYDHNFYLPIPYAKHCKITYETDVLELRYEYAGTPVEGGYWWPDVFYNICYREYGPQVRVKSFTKKALEEAAPLIARTAESLLEEFQITTDATEFQTEIAPGDTFSLQFDRRSSAIDYLSLRIRADDAEQALRSTVLTAAFDGRETVWVPIGEFFGSGYTVQPHKTWMNGADGDSNLVSVWPMPWLEEARLSFVNFGHEHVQIDGSVGLAPYKWTPESMYFGAAWHEYNRLSSRDENNQPFDLNFVDIDGKGVYVGDQITLFNNTYHWWGEGDEKIFVDGEAFPSSFGTGSEDYYGYSFGRPDPFSHPFVAQPIGKGNTSWGVTVNLRQRALDAIPFTTSISSNMEMWHWADVTVNFAMTSFFYLKLPAAVNVIPDSGSARRKVAKTREDMLSE